MRRVRRMGMVEWALGNNGCEENGVGKRFGG